MKIKLTAGQSFQIDPEKRYLLLIAPHVELPEVQVEEIKGRLNPVMPNVVIEILPPGSKYKLVELAAEAK